MLDIKHLIKAHAAVNIPLNYGEAYELGGFLLQGCNGDELAQIQSLAVLSALHNLATYHFRLDKSKNYFHEHALPINSAEQIAGICAAIFDNDIAKSEFGFLNPQVSCVMDNCGMGGDFIVTANVSTLSALIASMGGVAVCKHGSPANADQGKHGSSDFIALLGINTLADKSQVETCVEEASFGYTEALDTRYKRIHLQTHQYAKLPHMNDIIGPITNPVNPKILTRRILGVNHLVPPLAVAMAYQILNKHGVTNLQHGLFIRGYADTNRTYGVDELSICEGGSLVVQLIDERLFEYHLYADYFGIEDCTSEQISPPQGVSKGEFSMRIVNKEIDGSALEMVLANTAMLLFLHKDGQTHAECYNQARLIYQYGDIHKKVDSIKRYLHV